MKKKSESVGKPSILDYDSHSVNPFMDEAIIEGKFKDKKAYKGKNVSNIITNDGTIEEETTMVFSAAKEVDSSLFIKIFLNNVNVLFNLNKSGQKVLAWIIQEKLLIKNSDIVHITLKHFTMSSAYSRRVYYAGIPNLLENRILAKKGISNDTYFLNPAVIFNGNRIACINTYKALPEGQKSLQNAIVVSESVTATGDLRQSLLNFKEVTN